MGMIYEQGEHVSVEDRRASVAVVIDGGVVDQSDGYARIEFPRDQLPAVVQALTEALQRQQAQA